MNESGNLHKILEQLTPEQLAQIQVDPIDIIAGDRTLITYRPKLNQLTGSVMATILLQQIMHWWVQKRRPFYKFREPCSHVDCRPGDSWTEELGFSKHEFDTALKKIAVKVTYEVSREEALQTGLVIYWTDMDRKTWYELNEPLLRLKLVELYSKSPLQQGAKESEPRKSGIRKYVNPESGNTYNRNADLPKSTKSKYVNPESGISNIGSTETTLQRLSAETTIHPPPDGPVVERKEEDALVQEIAEALRSEGVFAGPAREIAQQAAGAGLAAAAVVDVFQAHLKQSGKVELATWRLKEGLLEMPASGVSVDPRRREFQLSMGEESQEAPDKRSSASQSLWDSALDILRGQVTRSTFEKHLRGSYQQSLEDGPLTVVVSSEESRAWLAGPRRKQILRALQQVEGSGVGEVQFVVPTMEDIR